jgi:hypothetical protein
MTTGGSTANSESAGTTLPTDPITIQMVCGCSAKFEMSCPPILIDIAVKQANTWQKFHSCPSRREPPAHNDAWLKAGLGTPCVVCSEKITEEGPEWWKVAGQWVHIDCVMCADCGMPARGNGSMVYTIYHEFVHVKCPKGVSRRDEDHRAESLPS